MKNEEIKKLKEMIISARVLQASMIVFFLLSISFGLSAFDNFWQAPKEVETSQAMICYTAEISNRHNEVLALQIPIGKNYETIFESSAPAYYPLGEHPDPDWKSEYKNTHSLITKSFIEQGGRNYGQCIFLANTKVKVSYKKKFSNFMVMRFYALSVWIDDKQIIDESNYLHLLKINQGIVLISLAITCPIFLLGIWAERRVKEKLKNLKT